MARLRHPQARVGRGNAGGDRHWIDDVQQVPFQQEAEGCDGGLQYLEGLRGLRVVTGAAAIDVPFQERVDLALEPCRESLEDSLRTPKLNGRRRDRSNNGGPNDHTN